MKHILIATPDGEISRCMGQALPDGLQVSYVETKQKGLAIAKKNHPDLIFVDLEMLLDGGGRDEAAERLKEFKSLCDDAEVVVMADKDRIRSAVNTVKAGAADYLTYPIDPSEVAGD